MVFLSFLVAFVCFLLAALAPVFTWTFGRFDPIAWGLTFLALGFLLPGAVGAYRRSRIEGEIDRCKFAISKDPMDVLGAILNDDVSFLAKGILADSLDWLANCE